MDGHLCGEGVFFLLSYYKAESRNQGAGEPNCCNGLVMYLQVDCIIKSAIYEYHTLANDFVSTSLERSYRLSLR